MGIEHKAPDLRLNKSLAIIFIILWSLTSSAVTVQEATPAPKYSSGTELCVSCHNKLIDTKMGHAVFLNKLDSKKDAGAPSSDENHFCEACHGSSADHVKRQAGGKRPPPPMSFNLDTPAQNKNAMCLTCHNGPSKIHWAGSPHDIEGTACIDCHGSHVEHDPILSLATQSKICHSCHEDKDQVVQTDQSQHLMKHSQMSCSSCHSSHAGLDEVLCVDCHQQNEEALAQQSTKALAFHQTAKNNNLPCLKCHKGMAHGVPDWVKNIQRQQQMGDYDIHQIITGPK